MHVAGTTDLRAGELATNKLTYSNQTANYRMQNAIKLLILQPQHIKQL
jgi:hypothetical protein